MTNFHARKCPGSRTNPRIYGRAVSNRATRSGGGRKPGSWDRDPELIKLGWPPPIKQCLNCTPQRGSWTRFLSYRSVSDPQKLAAYELAVAETAPFGARILARGNPAIVYEDGLKERTVITEYPSLDKATASYATPAYHEALKALGDGAVRDVRIVEGLE